MTALRYTLAALIIGFSTVATFIAIVQLTMAAPALVVLATFTVVCGFVLIGIMRDLHLMPAWLDRFLKGDAKC